MAEGWLFGRGEVLSSSWMCPWNWFHVAGEVNFRPLGGIGVECFQTKARSGSGDRRGQDGSTAVSENGGALGLEVSSIQAVDHPGEWFSVRHAWIRCDAERKPSGSWGIEITIYVRQSDPEGVFMEKRMVPTPLMKEALEKAGLATKFDGSSLYPSLVGELPPCASPSSVLASISQVMDGADQRKLWNDPFPDEWEQYSIPTSPPAHEILLPVGQ